jgi:PIN domain nuclease of toxin-antitoxin system
MRRLLLDTHVLLWLLLEPSEIPDATLTAIRDRTNDVLVSAASAWEIATKHRLGRLDQARAVVDGYAAHLETLGAVELPITGHDALIAGQMPWDHQDPFDRMLVSQAMLRSLVLVTKDEAIRASGRVNVVW